MVPRLRYVLKIAHPSEDPTVAELLTAVLLHLGAD